MESLQVQGCCICLFHVLPVPHNRSYCTLGGCDGIKDRKQNDRTDTNINRQSTLKCPVTSQMLICGLQSPNINHTFKTGKPAILKITYIFAISVTYNLFFETVYFNLLLSPFHYLLVHFTTTKAEREKEQHNPNHFTQTLGESDLFEVFWGSL